MHLCYISSTKILQGLGGKCRVKFGKINIWQNKHFSATRGYTEEDYLKAMKERIPLGRVGKTDDIANMCVFLCSNRSSYITGQNLDVSGGEEMH